MLQRLWDATKAAANWLPRKVVYVMLTAAIEVVRAKLKAEHPDWVLPSTEQVLAAGALLIGCHSLQDALYAVRDILTAYAQTKRV